MINSLRIQQGLIEIFHFKSFAIEIQQRIEFILAANEKFGSTFNLPGHYSKKNRSQQYYVFGGLGLCYFIQKHNFQMMVIGLI